MRNIPQEIISQITKGSEPVFVVGVSWVDGSTTNYSTKDNILNCLPYVQSVSGLETITKINGGSATNFEIIFEDSSGHFKNLFDTIDLHFRPVTIYQYFDGFGSGLYPIFYGQISTPISWDEGQRTLSVTALTRESNLDVGFSVEEGQFPKIHESLIGKPWPLGIGTPIHVPALALQIVPTGMITKAFGIADPTLDLEISKLQAKLNDLLKVISIALFYASHAANQGDTDLAEQWNQVSVQAQSQKLDIERQIGDLGLIQIQQKSYEHKENFVIGGYRFPQNKRIKVKINEFLFYAVFHGKEGSYSTSAPINFDAPCRVTLSPILPPIRQGYNLSTGELDYQKQGFTYIQAGSQITIIDDFQVDWVANCLPSEVKAVYAYRSFNGKRQLTLVPTAYYTIINDNYKGFTGPTINPTIIRMKRPLSTIAFYENLRTTRAEDLASFNAQTTGVNVLPHIVNNIDWDDQIYVTYESPVGPNLVDILIWLIETYTTYTYDVTSFNAIRSKVDSYPMNFCLFDRPLVDTLLGDLAYQGRCRIYIKGNTYYLKFLAEEDTAVETITLADIEENTLKISTTDTEEIITKSIGTWRTDYVKPENKIVIRHNANAKFYGIQESNYNFFAYNDRELVERVLTFWSIRTSNTWKLIECTLHLNMLNLETNDTVNIDIGGHLASTTVSGIIEACEYDLDTYSIRVKIWTPVRLGEKTAYQFAYPANISKTIFYPTFNEISSGAAGGFNQGVQGALPPGSSSSVTWPDSADDSNEQAPSRPRDYGSKIISDVDYVPRPAPVPTSPVINFNPDPTFQYDYSGFAPLPTVTDSVSYAVYPGEIVSGSGDTYTVKIWKKGLTGKSVNIQAKQLMIDAAESFDPGIKCHVVMNKDSKGREEYTIQIPVWLPE